MPSPRKQQKSLFCSGFSKAHAHLKARRGNVCLSSPVYLTRFRSERGGAGVGGA